MRLTVVGCGDAFGSGGRLQSCYFVELAAHRLLIDCGASAMIGLNRLKIDANSIGTILISHLHGDHFAGLVWWMLHAQHVAKRTEPMTIVGPPGIENRFVDAAEALFPGSTSTPRRFSMSFREITAGGPLDLGAAGKATAFEVSHPSGAPSHALRLEAGGRTLAFSGDTEWSDALIPCGHEADLFVMECYAFDGAVRYHMSWSVIAANLPRIAARRIMLTHMNEGMLARRAEVKATGVILADDGLVVEV